MGERGGEERGDEEEEEEEERRGTRRRRIGLLTRRTLKYVLFAVTEKHIVTIKVRMF